MKKGYWLPDGCRIRLEAKDPLRFLSVASSMGVHFYDVGLRAAEADDACIVSVRRKDLRKLQEAAVKTAGRFTVEKESGILSFLRYFISRKAFFISLAAAGAALYLLTLFLWRIDISGCVNRKEAEILETIVSCHVDYGTLKSRCDCEKIEEAIRNQYDDILWVSASVKGTGLFVQIKENTYLNDKLALHEGTSDLVADRAGKVVGIVTRTGVPLVKEGDEVAEGDVLISGAEEYFTDDKEVLRTNLTYADGDILLESAENIEWHYERTMRVRKYGKRKRHGLKLSLFDHAIIDYQPKIRNSDFDVRSKAKVLVLGDAFYLPVDVESSLYQPYETVEYRLSDEALKTYAAIRYRMFCIKQEQQGMDIMEKNAKIRFDENGCTVSLSMVYRGPCGVSRPIAADPVPEEPTEGENG